MPLSGLGEPPFPTQSYANSCSRLLIMFLCSPFVRYPTRSAPFLTSLTPDFLHSHAPTGTSLFPAPDFFFFFLYSTPSDSAAVTAPRSYRSSSPRICPNFNAAHPFFCNVLSSSPHIITNTVPLPWGPFSSRSACLLSFPALQTFPPGGGRRQD